MPGMITMKKDAVFIYSDELLSYSFSNEHPFNQMRLKLNVRPIKGINRISGSMI